MWGGHGLSYLSRIKKQQIRPLACIPAPPRRAAATSGAAGAHVLTTVADGHAKQAVRPRGPGRPLVAEAPEAPLHPLQRRQAHLLKVWRRVEAGASGRRAAGADLLRAGERRPYSARCRGRAPRGLRHARLALPRGCQQLWRERATPCSAAALPARADHLDTDEQGRGDLPAERLLRPARPARRHGPRAPLLDTRGQRPADDAARCDALPAHAGADACGARPAARRHAAHLAPLRRAPRARLPRPAMAHQEDAAPPAGEGWARAGRRGTGRS